MDTVKTIQKYLLKLGLEVEATTVYIEMVRLGPTSALQLTRETGISRTQIYRHLETLKQHGLASAEKLSYGTLFRALPIENIEGTLANREAETAALRRNLSGMAQALQHLAGSANNTKAAVQHHYGIAGLKQMLWNMTKADIEYRCFEVAHLSQHLDKAFVRHCRERFIENKLTSYDLTNAATITSPEFEPFNPEKTFARHIDPGILSIDFEVCIYNDVVSLFDYSKDNIMGIEIHHPALHTMMRQLFDAMWAQAEPLKIT